MILSIFFELPFPLDLSIVLFWRGDCELRLVLQTVMTLPCSMKLLSFTVCIGSSRDFSKINCPLN
jgi:hypothetical protein